MAVETIEGVISGVHLSTETHGSVRDGKGRISSVGVMNFRVGGIPAQIKLNSTISIQDGDKAVLTGKSKNGTFKARGIYNYTSGAIDALPVIPFFVGGVLITLLSIPLLFVIVGIGTMPLGIFLIYNGILTKKAVEILNSYKSAKPQKMKSAAKKPAAKDPTEKKPAAKKPAAKKPAAKDSTVKKPAAKKPAAKKPAAKKPAAKKPAVKDSTVKKPAAKKPAAKKPAAKDSTVKKPAAKKPAAKKPAAKKPAAKTSTTK